MKRYISLRTLAAVTASVARDCGANAFPHGIRSEMRSPPVSGTRVAESRSDERSARASSPDWS